MVALDPDFCGASPRGKVGKGAYYRDLAGSSENRRAPALGNSELEPGPSPRRVVLVEETARTFADLADRLNRANAPPLTGNDEDLTDSAPGYALGASFFQIETGPTESPSWLAHGLRESGEDRRGGAVLGPVVFLLSRETGSRRHAPRWELCTEPTKREKRRESGRTTTARRPR